MSLPSVSRKAVLKKENIDPYRYTLSLIKEGVRLGIFGTSTLQGMQTQIMSIVKDLTLRYTGGESSSVKLETAEAILNSVYYTLDAYMNRYRRPETALAMLASKDISELYEKGVAEVRSCVKETQELHFAMLSDKLEVPMEVYRSTLEDSFIEFFAQYNMVFFAHETACSADYPLVFDDMQVQGIYYIRNYLVNLNIETRFCKLFSTAAILDFLHQYGRKYHVDYKDSPVNLFEILLCNTLFSIMAGNSASCLEISLAQYEGLDRHLYSMDTEHLKNMLDDVFDVLSNDLGIKDPHLNNYLLRYKPLFLKQLDNALKNHSLHNLVVVYAGKPDAEEEPYFIPGNRMADSDFRKLLIKVMNNSSPQEKISLIKSNIHSIEDFIDLIEANCLSNDELKALIITLSEEERSILAKYCHLYND